MKVWLAFVLGGLATYSIRASFILFFGDRDLPRFAERALQYAGPAAFAAIMFPATLGDRGLAGFTSPDARLFALIIAGVAIYRTRNVVSGLVLGMIALWILRWL